MINLFLHELSSRWKAILWWSLGLTAFTAMYAFVWPQAEEAMTEIAGLAIYEALGFYMQSFEAYLGSVVLLFLPLLLGIYVIVTGTKTLAGEEDEGTLELLLARPLSRWQVVVAKAGAIALSVVVILLLAGAGNAGCIAFLKSSYETSLMPAEIFRATLSAWPIVMAIAMISLSLGAFAPKRRIASMVATVFLVVSYFGENASAMVESLDWIKKFSIFTYFDTSADAFAGAPAASDVLILLAIAVVFFALSLLGFQLRDVTVGVWSWKRSRVSVPE